MSMLKAPRSQRVTRHHELQEDQFITASEKALDFFEEHRTALIGAGVALVLLVLGVIGYGFYRQGQEADAQTRLGAAFRLYEAGEFQQALDGTDDTPGLVEIADGSGASADLAAFYAANAYLQLDQPDEALEYFAEYDGDDGIVAASARAGQAAVLEARGEHEEAAELYARAARLYTGAAVAPQYLMDAARNYEAAGDLDEAREALERIVADYEDAPQAVQAQIQLAQIEAAASAE